MFNHILNKLTGLHNEAARLGWWWTISYRLLKRLGIKEVKLKARGLPTPVYCRIADSDIYEFNQSLGKWEEPLKLPFHPQTIVDAGANVGYASLRFSKYFPNATIVAIEPETKNIEQFKKNCSFYRNIFLEERALWPVTTNLRIKSYNGASNAFQVFEDPAGNVKTISIIELMKKFGFKTIDLLKIDIEGSEKQLFAHQNARDWLPLVKVILVETHDTSLNVEGCQDSVQKATSEYFEFQGYVNEYEYYLTRQPLAE